MYCGTKSNYNYQIIGLSDDFPTLDNCNRNWKQFVVTETLNLSECNPDIETIDKIYISSEINKTIIVETPLSNPPLVQNLEGSYLSGRKLLVEGQLCQTIVYTSLTDCQSVHSVSFVNPFSTYIILSNPNLELGPSKNINVNVYIEDVFATLINSSSIFKSVSLFVTTDEDFVANYVGNITITPAITLPGTVTGSVTFQNTVNTDVYYGTISNGTYNINILEPGTYNLIDASILVGGQSVDVDIPNPTVSITVPSIPTCSSGNAGPAIALTLAPATVTGTITGLTPAIANALTGLTVTVNGGTTTPLVTVDLSNPLLPTYSFETTDIGASYTLGALTAQPNTIILAPLTANQPLATIDLASLGTTITADIPIVPSIVDTLVSGAITGITPEYATALTNLALTVTNGTTTVPVTIDLTDKENPTYSFTADQLGTYVLNAITPTPASLVFDPTTLNQVLATITTANAGTPIADVDIAITPSVLDTTISGALSGLNAVTGLLGLTMNVSDGITTTAVPVNITNLTNPTYSFTSDTLGASYTVDSFTANPTTISIEPVTADQPLATITAANAGTTITTNVPVVPATTVTGTLTGITAPYAADLTGLTLTVTDGVNTIPAAIDLSNTSNPTYSFVADGLGTYTLDTITTTPNVLTFTPNTLNQTLATITSTNAGSTITTDIPITPSIPDTTISGSLTNLGTPAGLIGLTLNVSDGTTTQPVTVDTANSTYSFTTNTLGAAYTVAGFTTDPTTITVAATTPNQSLGIISSTNAGSTITTNVPVNVTIA